MKKLMYGLLLIAFCLLPGLKGFAQLSVVITPPPPNRLNIQDLWNITIYNSSQTTYTVYIDGELNESEKGLVMQGTSQQFQAGPGMNKVGSSLLGKIDVSYSDNDVKRVVVATGAMPSGFYRLCIQVRSAENSGLLCRDCITQNVSILSVPALLAPYKGFEVKNRFPVFNWLSPSPAKSTQMLTYTMKIVEILSNQSAYSAMNSNPDFYVVTNITSPMLQYGISCRYFEEGKKYAWKVKAYLNGVYINESEVWDFKYVPFEEQTADKNKKDSLKKTHSSAERDLYIESRRPENLRELNRLCTASGINLSGSANPESSRGNDVRLYSPNVILSGLYTIEGQTATRQGTDQNSPKNYARFMLNPSLSIYGVPIGVNVLLTTEKDGAKQSIDNISFNFSSSALIEQVKKRAVVKILGPNNEKEYENLTAMVKDPENIKLEDAIREMENLKLNDPKKQEELNNLKEKLIKVNEAKKRLEQLEQIKNDAEEIMQSKDPYTALDKAVKYVPVSKWTKFFTGFRKLDIGTSYPVYSDLTLNSVPLSGLDAEYNYKLLYVAVSGLRNNKEIQSYENSGQPVYNRKIFQSRLGIGNYDKSHLYFTYMTGWDNPGSVKTDSTTFVTPAKNYVIGAEAKLSLFDQMIVLTGEAAASLLTNDLNSPPIKDVSSIPDIVNNLFEINISSSADYSYKIRGEYNNPKTNTRFSADFAMLGPGFTSFGSPDLTTDKISYGFDLNQILLDNKIIFTAFLKKSKDNLIMWKKSTTQYLSYGITAGLTFPKMPYLQFSVFPSYQNNDINVDSLKVDNSAMVMNIASGYPYMVKNFSMFTNINYVYQNNRSFNYMSNFYTHNILVNQTVGFTIPLNVTAGFGYTTNDLQIASYKITTFSLSANYRIGNNWDATAGSDFSMESTTGKKLSFFLSTRFPVWQFGNMDISAQYNDYNSGTGLNSFNELLFRLNLSRSF